MTKKDYIRIAEAIRSSRMSLAYASVNVGELDRTINITARTMAVMLQNDNSRFDSIRFLKACGIEQEREYLQNTCNVCGEEMIGVHYHE